MHGGGAGLAGLFDHAIKQIRESSPLLRREAEITQSRITFPQTGAVIQALGNESECATVKP